VQLQQCVLILCVYCALYTECQTGNTFCAIKLLQVVLQYIEHCAVACTVALFLQCI
jgi:hypothetical protein